jgi:quinol-cytochrome oxidoreductase complex cytochrome b subunit
VLSSNSSNSFGDPAAPGDASSRRENGWRRWLPELTAVSATLDLFRQQAQKPVPKRLSWLYTMGTLAAFFFALQFLTGILLLVFYVPDERLAYGSVQTVEHKVPLGWLVRQMHSWGASFIVMALIFHIIKVLWYGSYKQPRQFTWFVGFILFALTMGFCLSGYLLPWNQLAFWATRVAVGAVDSVPIVGGTLKGLICGGADVSGRTLGRFFALHVIVLPWILILGLALHLRLVLKHGITPKTSTEEERILGYVEALERHGAEPFFPRQVYRELLVLNLGFGLLVLFATYFPWELGEPKSLQTPTGIKPEWYFLPVYQFLKYFDDDLYARLPFLESLSRTLRLTPDVLGVLSINLVGLILFCLPILDRGKERSLRRRPFFAAFAFFLFGGILLLGGLGYVSEKTITIAGATYHFSSKGYPERVASAPEGSAAEEGGLKTAGGTPKGPEPAPPVSYRADGLPGGGTCGGADCHSKEHEEWQGSIHDQNQVECRGCHGGIDTAPPSAFAEGSFPGGLDAQTYAHLGIKQKKKKVDEKEVLVAVRPAKSEIPAFCGKCHEDVKSVFSPLHLEKPPDDLPQKSCVTCHKNHAVAPAGDETFEAKGAYGDAADPRSAPFLAAREIFRGLSEKVAKAEEGLARLKSVGYPVEGFSQEIEAAKKKAKESRRLVHALDREVLSKEVADIEGDLKQTTSDMEQYFASRDERWKLVAGVWSVVGVLSVLIVLKLRGMA